MIVIDSSAVGALILEDEQSPPGVVLDQLLETQLIAPPHWPFEVANLILNAERRQRVAAARRSFLLDQVRSLRVALDRDSGREVWTGGMAIADEYRLTVYDAAYLEVAIRLGAALVTLDHDLMRATHIARIPLVTWPLA